MTKEKKRDYEKKNGEDYPQESDPTKENGSEISGDLEHKVLGGKEKDRLLRNFLIGLGICMVVLLGIIWGINSFSQFNYRGLNFNVVKDEGIIFYNVDFPVYSRITGKHLADYNIYIRNDPRKLDKEVLFEGDITLRKKIILKEERPLNCGGDGAIGIANLLNLEIFGKEFGKNENATCDTKREYTLVRLTEGNESKIEQEGPSCYTLYVNNCEVLAVTEKFLVESLLELKNERLYKLN